MSPDVQRKLVGIIDIGSNSVRYVVFDITTCAPTYYYNEKVMCALAADLSRTGSLLPTGKVRAIRAIKRFQALSVRMGIDPVQAIATAAMREASDGRAFQNEIFRETSLSVRIISGAEEARLAAQGVCLGIPDASGVVADLGGGSLELSPVSGGNVYTGISLPYGVLRRTQSREEVLREKFRELILLDNINSDLAQNLYLVGGSWRAIAKVHMAQTKYPLSVVNDYTLTCKQAEQTVSWILGSESADIPVKLSESRLAALKPAAVTLQALIERIQPESIRFSALGVREGFLVDILDLKEPAFDPFVTACRVIEGHRGRCKGFGDELFAFVASLFDQLHTGRVFNKEVRRRLHAACLLSDVSWRMHPDYRAESCFETATRIYLTGVSHTDRIWIGGALLHRHKGGKKMFNNNKACESLAETEKIQATLAGQAMRLGIVLAGAQTGILPHCHFIVEQERVCLTLSTENTVLNGETVEKYLSLLSKTAQSIS